MEAEEISIIASFKLQVVCANCLARSAHRLDVPDEADAPVDEDELIESAYLANQRFGCKKCEYPIGQIVALSKIRRDAA